MKKVFVAIICLALLISLCSCDVIKGVLSSGDNEIPVDIVESQQNENGDDSSKEELIDTGIDTSNEAVLRLEDRISALQAEQAQLKDKLEAGGERQKEYFDTLVLSIINEIDATEELIEEYELIGIGADDIKASLIAKENELNEQIEAAFTYVADIQSDQAAIEAEYEKAKAAEDQANKDIAALLAQRAKEQAQNNSGSYKPVYGGKLIWPVSGYSRISSPFGPRTLWGKYDYHLGIDIPAPSGTSVNAAAAGEVVIAGYSYNYGYYVVIDHGDGYATLYAHNRQLLVSAGQIVSQGQKIAEIGMSGSASGNYLHFEVRINGQVQNPQLYTAP
ncbi:MAG: peptidoglycan DD-metalloendopeptidase family protein [Clostridia bacterium]|nr:peptidoglycan DD-metalloendopeptidase family protein [Clostridia bacterium]